MAANDHLIIGIDGGATEVKAHEVTCARPEAADGFALGPASASRKYERLAAFAPVPVADQIKQREANRIEFAPGEVEQGRLWIAAAAACVADIVKSADKRPVIIGMGMPGLKTPDGRGINAINNGPRMPGFLDDLQRLLSEAGVSLASPIAALGSDADYCGLGEQYAETGLLRDVENAYYVGCGTGIADAMKLGGKLVPFDAAKPWLQKSWQLPSSLGPTFEKLISAKSLNDVYHAMLRGTLAGLPASGIPERFPEVEALQGRVVAVGVMDNAALLLAELLFERLSTIFAGRAEAPHRGPAYLQLSKDHPYRGTVLDRMIIGQRLGAIYAADDYRKLFGSKVDAYLGAMIGQSGATELDARFLTPNGRLRDGLLRGSTLRAAPAIGAAVAAMQARLRA
jgi:hypothetical protein